jgi:hypothetical protein
MDPEETSMSKVAGDFSNTTDEVDTSSKPKSNFFDDDSSSVLESNALRGDETSNEELVLSFASLELLFRELLDLLEPLDFLDDFDFDFDFEPLEEDDFFSLLDNSSNPPFNRKSISSPSAA